MDRQTGRMDGGTETQRGWMDRLRQNRRTQRVNQQTDWGEWRDRWTERWGTDCQMWHTDRLGKWMERQNEWINR